jgi:hypothetical protein
MIREQIHKIVDDIFDLHSSLFPFRRFADAHGHFRRARREVLLGLRAVLDSALDRMENQAAANQFVRVPLEGQPSGSATAEQKSRQATNASRLDEIGSSV